MNTPDVTPAQAGTVAAALAAVLAIVYQAPERLQIPLLIVLGALGVAWLISDAVIRHGRSGAVAAQHNLSAAQLSNLPADGVDQAPPGQP
jgi:hypothetical protein